MEEGQKKSRWCLIRLDSECLIVLDTWSTGGRAAKSGRLGHGQSDEARPLVPNLEEAMDTGSDQKRNPEGALAFLLECCKTFLTSAVNPIEKAQTLLACMAMAETHLTPVVKSREERLEEALNGLSTVASRIWRYGGLPAG